MAIVSAKVLDHTNNCGMSYFTLYTTLNITKTGNFTDNTQKDFESVIQVIGMQYFPVITRDPLLLDGSGKNTLEKFGSPTLTGAGWKARLVFIEGTQTIEKLKEELNGIVLNSGTIDTNCNVNMEFTETE